MEPLSALGLACSIVTFVDFGCSLLSSSHSICRSAHGLSADSVVLDTISTDLSDLCAKFQRPRNGSATDWSSTGSTALVKDCKRVADELRAALDSLRVHGPNKRWKSFQAALKEVWSNDRIQALRGQLETLQRQLNTRLLYDMRNDQSNIYRALSMLEEQNREFEMAHTQHLDDLKEDLLSALSQTQRGDKSARGYFVDAVRTISATSPSSDMFQGVQRVRPAVEKLAAEADRIDLNMRLLERLRFRTMEVRHSNIAEAHARTFQWVLEDDAAAESSFYRWLATGNGTFWVTGKPGSGKSTLMKFLARHERTHQALSLWAGSKKLVIAKCFFWNAGTKLQKSLEGLLRSLLFEILRQCPDLIACMDEDIFKIHVHSDGPWLHHELLETLRRVSQRTEFSAKFCFFIDGLDEYEPEHEHDLNDLVSLLQDLSTVADIKLCVSSRPWNIFWDNFGQDTARLLRLENLTRTDIQTYVADKFLGHTRFAQLSEDPLYLELVEEVVDKARGVFLWVYLVVKSLLDGFTNADHISDLQRRLRALPSDLKPYFEHIFDAIDPFYKDQTTKTLQVSLEAIEPPPLTVFSFVLDASPNFELTDEDLGPRGTERRLDDARRRLDACCKGLLEVIRDAGPYYCGFPYCNARVDFLHRTVKEFLLESDARIAVELRGSQTFDPQWLLCQAYLAQLRLIQSCAGRDLGRHNYHCYDYVFANIAQHAKRIEARDQDMKNKLFTLLDQAVGISSRLPSVHGLQLLSSVKQTLVALSPTDVFLTVVTKFGLWQYVRHYIESGARQHELVVLLESAAIIQQRQTHERLPEASFRAQLDAIGLLLQACGGPNVVCPLHHSPKAHRQLTLWGCVLKNQLGSQGSDAVRNPTDELKQLLHFFILSGAEMGRPFKFGSDSRASAWTARGYIGSTLPSNMATELLECEKTRRKSIVKRAKRSHRFSNICYRVRARFRNRQVAAAQ